jgi:Ribbon-helix-helix protein, copG family
VTSRAWAWLVIPVYTLLVKTAISLPDDTFDEVTRRAHELGISRSEFFTTAARRYLEALDAASVTRQIDAVLESVGGDDSSGAAVAAGRRLLGRSDDDW